jgi:hypothetical protein
VGQFASRVGRHLGQRVIAVQPVPERRRMAERHGVETIDFTKDVGDQLRDLTDGREPTQSSTPSVWKRITRPSAPLRRMPWDFCPMHWLRRLWKRPASTV